LGNPRNKRFVAAFKTTGGGEEPDQYAQAGYDSIFLLAEAIKQAGSTNPAKMREALTRSDYVSATGSPIRFDEAKPGDSEALCGRNQGRAARHRDDRCPVLGTTEQKKGEHAVAAHINA
jgi:Periplasmic binding protein